METTFHFTRQQIDLIYVCTELQNHYLADESDNLNAFASLGLLAFSEKLSRPSSHHLPGIPNQELTCSKETLLEILRVSLCERQWLQMYNNQIPVPTKFETAKELRKLYKSQRRICQRSCGECY